MRQATATAVTSLTLPTASFLLRNCATSVALVIRTRLVVAALDPPSFAVSLYL